MNRGIDNIRFYIDGTEVSPPIEFPDLTYKATADNNSQPAIELQDLTFAGDANNIIREAILKGEQGDGVGIFEGLPFKITQSDNIDSFNSFDGYIDLTTFRAIDFATCTCEVKSISGRQNIEDTLTSLTYGFLEDEGVFNNSDFTNLPFVVEKRRNATEKAIGFLMLFQLGKEFAEAVRRTSKAIAEIQAIISGSATGGFAAAVYAIALALLEAAYAAVVLVLILNMVTDVVKSLLPQVNNHKTTTLRKLIEKPLEYLGLSLQTNLPLSDEVYLPSNAQGLSDDKFIDVSLLPKAVANGLPKVTESAYTVGGILDIIRNRFNADWVIKDNTFFLYNEDDDFFTSTASYTIPPSFDQYSFSYNTDELVNSRFISFLTDVKDDFTTDNFKGTNYQVITQPKTINEPLNVQILGNETYQINCALGTRKDGFNDFENIMLEVTKLADDLIGFFGGNSNISSLITNRIGVMKQSDEFHTVPKLVPLKSGKIPINYRSTLSAKSIYNDYYVNKSFVENGFYGQKKRHVVNVGMTFEDFLLLVDNFYCYDSEGKSSKITDLQYNQYSASASFAYWNRRVYTTNLKEIHIEP
jgi:hypothetical protein